MDFPELSLVQFAPRDLTGPGVEFWARRIAASDAANASFGVTIPADQTSSERIYLINWAFSLIPVGAIAKRARLYIQLPTIDIQVYGYPGMGFAGTINERIDATMAPIVIPGGKPLLFVVDFSAVGGPNTLEGWAWGYSFPKGNVLSF